MTFSEKLKQLRTSKGLTQDEMAQKLFVTRTAISKWETGKGYPAIDSLKLISKLFAVSIDELISDGDIDEKKQIDEQNARKMYYVAIAFLIAATAFSLFASVFNYALLSIGSAVCAIGYIAFALFSKPKYKRIEVKRLLIPYLISRLVVLMFVIGLMAYTIIQLA